MSIIPSCNCCSDKWVSLALNLSGDYNTLCNAAHKICLLLRCYALGDTVIEMSDGHQLVTARDLITFSMTSLPIMMFLFKMTVFTNVTVNALRLPSAGGPFSNLATDEIWQKDVRCLNLRRCCDVMTSVLTDLF